MIGCGCYANSHRAISGTGDIEVLVRNVAAHSVDMLMESGQQTLQQACDMVVHEREQLSGDMGLIAITADGQTGITFNSVPMHRGWARDMDEPEVAIYKSPAR